METPDKIAIRKDLMADHVPYEIAMMRATHDALTKGNLPQWPHFNAFLEAFAIHARQLIKFFNNTERGSRAKDFTDDYNPFANGIIPEELTDKLDQQIPHITERRVNSDHEKLNIGDVKVLRPLIDAEAARFVEHLQLRYKEIWDTKKGHLRPWA